MGSGLWCFRCGDIGHRKSDYKNQNGKKKTLFIDPENYEESDAEIGDEPEFDTGDMTIEEVLEDGMGMLLMERRSCLTPQTINGNWLLNNIFQSTYTILGKVCCFVINAKNCKKNCVSRGSAVIRSKDWETFQTIQASMAQESWRGNSVTTSLGFFFYWV